MAIVLKMKSHNQNNIRLFATAVRYCICCFLVGLQILQDAM